MKVFLIFFCLTLVFSEKYLSNNTQNSIVCTPITNNTISSADTICNGAIPLALSGTAPAGGAAPYSFLWLQSTNGTTWVPASGINNQPGYNPPALTTSTFFRRLVISDPSCTESDTSAAILITVVNLANAGINQTVCGDSTILLANTPVVGIGTWTLIGGAGTFQNINNPNTAVSAMNNGINAFLWTVNSGVCPISRDTVLVDSYKPATVSNAGPDISLCSVNSYTLAANTPAFGTGAWNLISPSGPSLSSVTQPNAVVSNLQPGQNVLEWVISTTVCPASRDTIIITVFTPPSQANAGADLSFCGSSGQLQAQNPTSGIGTWSVISGTANFANPNNPSATCTGLTIGNNTLLWTVNGGPCGSSSDTVLVQSFSLPSVSLAGNDQVFCNSFTATLNANTPSVGTANWNVITTGPSLSNSLSPSSAVSGLIPGINSLEWVISNGACPPSRDTVAITVFALPGNSFAGNDQIVCTTSAVMNASTPLVGTGQWSIVAGNGSFSSPASPTSNVIGLASGQNIFTWTLVNGTCPVSSDTVVITVQPALTAPNAGPDQTICINSSVLSANTPSNGTGTWNAVTGGPVFSNPTNPNTSVGGLVLGQNILVWLIGNGQCASLQDTVVITVIANPSSVNAGNDFSVCGDSAGLSALTPQPGTGIWTIIGGGASIANISSPTTTVAGLSLGLNTLVWTVTNGVCSSVSDTLLINSLDSVSLAVAGSNQSVCGSSAALNAVVPVSGTGTWNSLTAGVLISNPASANAGVSNLVSGPNVFEWVVSNGACPDSRDTVIVDATLLPTNVNAGPDQNICGDSTFLNAAIPVNGAGSWSVISGTGVITNALSPNSFVSALSPGQNIFLWSVVNGTCSAVTDTVVLFSLGPVTIANAGNNQNLCAQTNSSINANLPVSGTGTWSVVSGTAVVANPSSPGSNVSSLQSGDNAFVWTISNGACPDSRDTIIIHVFPLPSAANAGPDQNVCGNNVALAAIAPTAGTGSWSVISGAANFVNASLNNTSASGLNNGNNLLLWTVSSGVCPPSYDTVQILILPSPSIAVAGPDSEICAFNYTLNGSIPVVGTGTWNLLSGAGTITQPGAATTPVTALGVGVNVFEWVISNGLCPDSRDTVQVTAYALPTIANAGPDLNTDMSSIQLAGNTPSVGTGTWSIFSGQGTVAPLNSPNAFISGLQDGYTSLVWTITNGVCPSSSDTLLVFYSSLLIPEVITPNGDGKNDVFEIIAFKGIGGIKLEVFNRWGGRVYYSENYQHDFDGRNLSEKDLADDTYYYVLSLPDERTFTGFLLIKRK
jgi:gliding motility-associated-like protein